ncbi:Protein of unknown function [Pyronema omphalodes CBS 100304]|uniref:Uncharacterized protein n=1 Tax=Pyronema omphalodes (strain CBS 100304) TaxID=1076935 RepID=U4KV03_PYROM|nr:Protein of unknown function [Pyronema omphalodes CBS 100304]
METEQLNIALCCECPRTLCSLWPCVANWMFAFDLFTPHGN